MIDVFKTSQYLIRTIGFKISKLYITPADSICVYFARILEQTTITYLYNFN